MTRSGMRSRYTPYLLIAPGLILLTMVSLVPLVTGLTSSLTDLGLLAGWERAQFVGLDNYRTLAGDSLFWYSLLRTVFWVGSVVAGQLIVGFVAALLMNREFRFRMIARTLMLIPWVTPSLTAVLTWRWMFNSEFGFVNYYFDLIGFHGLKKFSWFTNPLTVWPVMISAAIWKGFPFFYVNILAGLQMISDELFDAAKMDGVSPAQTLWYIIVPSIKHVLTVATLLAIIWTWNDFAWIWAFTEGGPANTTMVLSPLVYVSSFFYYKLGYASAIAVAAAVVMIGLAAYYLRQLNRREG